MEEPTSTSNMRPPVSQRKGQRSNNGHSNSGVKRARNNQRSKVSTHSRHANSGSNTSDYDYSSDSTQTVTSSSEAMNVSHDDPQRLSGIESVHVSNTKLVSERPGSEQSKYDYSSDDNHTATSGSSQPARVSRGGPGSLAIAPNPPASDINHSSTRPGSEQYGYSSDGDHTTTTESSQPARVSRGGPDSLSTVPNAPALDIKPSSPRPGSEQSKYDYSSDGDHTATTESSQPARVSRGGPDSSSTVPNAPALDIKPSSPRRGSEQSKYDYSSDGDHTATTESSQPARVSHGGPHSLSTAPNPIATDLKSRSPKPGSESDYNYSSDGDHVGSSHSSQRPRGEAERLPTPEPVQTSTSVPQTTKPGSQSDYSSDSDQATVTETSILDPREPRAAPTTLSQEASGIMTKTDQVLPRSESPQSEREHSSVSDPDSIMDSTRVETPQRESRVTNDPVPRTGNGPDISRSASRQSHGEYSTDSDQASSVGKPPGVTQKEHQASSDNAPEPALDSVRVDEADHTTAHQNQTVGHPDPTDECHEKGSDSSQADRAANRKKAHFVENESYVPSGYEKQAVSEAYMARSNRQNSDTSLLSQSKYSGRRHSGLTRPTTRTGASSVRHYSTMSRSGRDRRSNSNASLRSNASKSSGFISILNCMTERFIYETDPFEGTLKKCPRLTFHVVDKATSPVSIEILFGNTERRALPSYYYTSTEKNSSARSRRGTSGVAGSRQSSASPANSVIDAKNYPSESEYRREMDDFILEEDEMQNGNRQRAPKTKSRSGSTKSRGKSSGSRFGSPPREGTLPDIFVSEHTISQSPRGNSASKGNKRPVTSSSTKTNRSLGLPGKASTVMS